MISVLLATHNGSSTLRQTLESFRGATAPRGGWRFIIIDNASTDDTPAIVRGYAAKLPIEYLTEPRLGKAIALNTGLEHISGDLVVFVDDDVKADREFLTEWRRAADAHPEFAVLGGTIVPEFAVAPPAWLLEKDWITLLYTATVRDRPAGEMHLGETIDVYGPNMAIRPEIVANGFRFDERLMVGHDALIGDETEFVARIANQGYRIGFAPGPRVRHLIDAKQVTWSWILHRFYRHGRTRFFFQAIKGRPTVPVLFGVPRYLVRRFAQNALRLPLVLASLQEERIISHLHEMAYDIGAIRQARLMLESVAGSGVGSRSGVH